MTIDISKLTPEQLDALDSHLAARRAEHAAEPVMCQCGNGIEVTKEYGNSYGTHPCPKCFGRGHRRRGADMAAEAWDAVVAAQRTIQSVVREIQTWGRRDGDKISVTLTTWGAEVRYHRALVATIALERESGDLTVYALKVAGAQQTRSIVGIGDLWFALRETIGARIPDR